MVSDICSQMKCTAFSDMGGSRFSQVFLCVFWPIRKTLKLAQVGLIVSICGSTQTVGA